MQTKACRFVRRCDLRARRVVRRQRLCRTRVKHDAVERRQGASRRQQGLRAGALPGHHDFGGAQPQIDGIEQRHMHVEVLDGLRRDGRDQPIGLSRQRSSPASTASRMRFCAATALWLGVASSVVAAGRMTRPSASAAVR